MKVHLFFRSLNEKTGGGSHFNAIQYVRALRERGHTVVVHTFSAGHNAPPSDIELIEHKGRGMGLLAGRKYLSKLLHEYEADADIFFLYAAEFAWGGGLYRKKEGKVPVVVYLDAYLSSMGLVHADSLMMRLYRFKRWPWDKTIGLSDARHVDRFLPCSPSVREKYVHFGFPAGRFTVLPNIVPPLATQQVERTDNIIRVLYVGRLTYDKGIDLLIRALAPIRDIPWRLEIVGDNGEMRGEVEKRMKEGMPIELHGWVAQQELGRFYSAADIFVHPARWPDPAPRTIVDALYCGVPVVVPNDGGSAWIAGEAGLVFRNGNEEELRAALDRLMRDASLRGKLSQQASASAEKFAKASVVAVLERILQEVSTAAI